MNFKEKKKLKKRERMEIEEERREIDEIPKIRWEERESSDETEREREIREMKEMYKKMSQEIWLVAEGERMKGRKILEEMNYEIEEQKKIRRLIEEHKSEWYEESYKKGLISYSMKEIEKKWKKERQASIKRRYQIMKRIRLVVKSYGPMRRTFLPYRKRLIIDYHLLMKPMRGLISIIEMINYYCDSVDIYKYSPVIGSGYRYYTGEKVILYVIDEKMSINSIKKISKAARQKKANGYNIERCWKVIITLQKWKGCLQWERMKCVGNIGYYKLDPREESILAWKGCLSMNQLLEEWNHLSWCRKEGLEPWPYQWRKGIFDEEKEKIHREIEQKKDLEQVKRKRTKKDKQKSIFRDKDEEPIDEEDEDRNGEDEEDESLESINGISEDESDDEEGEEGDERSEKMEEVKEMN